jgi:agmatinase
VKHFLDIDLQYRNSENARYTVVLVPYDATSTWQKGADKGPDALINASCFVELYDLETDQEAYRAGIYTDRPRFDFSSPHAMIQTVRNQAKNYFQRRTLPIFLGGEHTISIGAVEAAFHAVHNLNVLQLDAHADLRNEYQNSKYNHACTMARIRELCPVVQVGIRSMDRSEVEFIQSDRFFPAQNIHDNDKWMEKAISQLTRNVYVTIDVDVFDPSVMPATGTPEPGGLLWYQVLKFLRKVIESKNLIGVDVVELCPKEDPHPAFLAAKLVYKIISYHHFKEKINEKT